MTDEELIARLREIQGQAGLFASVAADRIEALVKERDAAKQIALVSIVHGQDAEARAKRLEEALLWCSGSADFNEGGVARKGWLKVCAPLLTGGKDE